MKEESRIKLQTVLNSLEAEADPIAERLERYHADINRLEKMVEAYQEDFSEADYVFSPRVNRGKSEELTKYQNDLASVQKKCDQVQEQYDQILQNIDLIVEVLSADTDGEYSKSSLLYQEQDRHRIARDLHDTALTNISNLVTKIDNCKNLISLDPKKAQNELSIIRNKLSESVDGIRGVIYDLRPIELDSKTFRSSLLKWIESFNEDKKYKIETEIDEIFCPDNTILVTIYRIIEECFNNIRKHADAFKIHLIVQEQIGSYYVYVEDDGKGFDVENPEVNENVQFGIAIMKERVALMGGNVTIQSAPNAGTKIKILIPANNAGVDTNK
ncbi:MAG: sensor histidine kinase [Lachnospiraceae bacterium]|nr:sensor histidine kinase [Lachnospiraceae bacterium]